MSPRNMPLVLALAVAVVGCDNVTAPESQASMAASVEPGGKAAHVLMTCNTMVGGYEVDPAAARKVLPPEYDLALQPSGNALVYVQTSNCAGTGNGTDISPFGLADVWLVIDGPSDIDPVEGTVATLPTLNVYVLKAQTTSLWVKENCASIHFHKELVKELHLTDVPPRVGYLVEQTGRGFQWSEFLPCVTPPGSSWGECWMYPGMPVPVGYGLPPLPIGFNVTGYINQGRGTGAKKEMSCVLNMIGQGIIELNVDPKSQLAKLGIFGSSQTGLAFDAIAECDLLMTQN